MREIKFDAIYKPTGEHFKPINLDFNQNIVTGNFDGETRDWCYFSFDGKYGDVILRLYTGLIDKNGNSIYEGDLLQLSEFDKGEVDFYKGGWRVKTTPRYAGDEWRTSLWDAVTDEFVVVGNKYELAEEENA